jgi:hypothetical protein
MAKGHGSAPAGGRLQFESQSRIVAASDAVAHRARRIHMAKGQLRSNKEKKKPKQSKKQTAPAAPFGSSQNKTPPPSK